MDPLKVLFTAKPTKSEFFSARFSSFTTTTTTVGFCCIGIKIISFSYINKVILIINPFWILGFISKLAFCASAISSLYPTIVFCTTTAIEQISVLTAKFSYNSYRTPLCVCNNPQKEWQKIFNWRKKPVRVQSVWSVEYQREAVQESPAGGLTTAQQTALASIN